MLQLTEGGRSCHSNNRATARNASAAVTVCQGAALLATPALERDRSAMPGALCWLHPIYRPAGESSPICNGPAGTAPCGNGSPIPNKPPQCPRPARPSEATPTTSIPVTRVEHRTQQHPRFAESSAQHHPQIGYLSGGHGPSEPNIPDRSPPHRAAPATPPNTTAAVRAPQDMRSRQRRRSPSGPLHTRAHDHRRTRVGDPHGTPASGMPGPAPSWAVSRPPQMGSRGATA